MNGPFFLSDVVQTRWKNGKGATRELLKIPANSVDFDLRVSIAEVACDAAFSSYPGIDRIVAIVRGAGIELIDLPDRLVFQALCGQRSHVEFTGERALEGRLIDGPILDFNVMVRRDVARSALRIIDHASDAPLSACRLVFIARGNARVTFNDNSTIDLAEFQFIAPANAAHVSIADNSIALLVDMFNV